MNLDDIKSPLPSRKLNVDTSADLEEKKVLEVPESRQNTPIIPAKPKFNKKIIWMILGIIVLFLFIGLGLKFLKKEKKEDITLNYWGLWEDASIMNAVIADFENKNPGIKINYKRNQLADYRTRLVGRLAKTGINTIEDVDIFRIHNSWIPMFRDYLASVPTGTVEKIGLENDYWEVYKTDLKENNKWLSIPLMYDGLALFYNKDLLDVAKIEVPNDWWELREAAIKLTTKDENEVIQTAGAALGLVNSNVDHWSDIIGLMMKQNGIDMSKNMVNMDQNLEDVLKFYASFANSKEENVWDDSLPSSTNLFASGKLAFYFGPSWRVFDLEKLNKDLKYGITTVPQLPISGGISANNTALTDIHWSTYWTEGVNSKSKYQNEAWKFLEYLSSKEVLEKLYTAQSQVRNFGEIYPRKSLGESLKNNIKVWPFLLPANKASNWYLSSETGDDGLNSEMQKYFADAVNNITNTSDLEETMTTLKTGISQLQKKYNLKK